MQSSHADDCMNNCNNFCQELNLEVHGGIYPTFWVGRSGCSDNGCFAKFNDLFKLPWYVGGRLGYELNDCIELYGEVNFAQARGKNTIFNADCIVSADGITAIPTKASHYRIVSGYVGSHYYFNNACWCDNVDFFVGAKLGFVYHKAIKSTFSAPNIDGSLSPLCLPLFNKTTSVSAGGSLGVNYCFCDCFSIVFCVELVGTGALKTNTIICVPDTVSIMNLTAISNGQMSSELSVPVTLGLRWKF